MKRLEMLLVALLCVSFQLVAQTKVTGTVYDGADGSPMPGAQVVVTGTTNGAMTDTNGKFTVSVPQGKTITVSLIGFRSQTINPKGKNNIKITLQEDSKMMDEVVFVGYGTMKKSDISGASVTMSED